MLGPLLRSGSGLSVSSSDEDCDQTERDRVQGIRPLMPLTWSPGSRSNQAGGSLWHFRTNAPRIHYGGPWRG